MSGAFVRAAVCIALVLTIGAAGQAEAPEADPLVVRPILAAADLRDAIDLSGPWHVAIDPYRSGLSGFHGGAVDIGQQRYADVDVAKAMADDPSALFEYDMDREPTVSLPGSWLGQDATMRHYQGLVWYQRHFTVQPQPGERRFLRFGAANYTASVWLNGKLVGRHEGGFTPFAFDVTDALRPGDNQVTVGVDSVPTDASVPPPVTDWENYGGITRAVTLVRTPATYVDDAWVRLTRDGRIAVDAQLSGGTASGVSIRLSIPGAGVALNGVTDGAGHWSATLPAPRGLKRWSPDSPTLYDVAITAGEDRWRDRIGFRTIAVRGADILLNGKPVFLRGISLHEEELGTDPVRAMSPAAVHALLGEVKDGLHGNYVRLAHYPHDDTTLRAADEMGLLVWSEIPVYWRIAFANPATLATARHMLAENIRRDRNRAAIAIWSIANETPVSAPRNAFLTTLAGDVRRLDDSRLVSAALLTERKRVGDHAEVRITDPVAGLFDVLAINTYFGWYGNDRLADLPSIRILPPADKPLLFSEFGADALAGYRDPTGTHKFSEEYQAAYYRTTLAMVDRIPTLRGLSPWILKDFRSPRRQHPVYQQGWNRKGLISETGRRKLAFAVLADHYRDIARSRR